MRRSISITSIINKHALRLWLPIALLLIASCGANPPSPNPTVQTNIPIVTDPIDALLARAQQAPESEAGRLLIDAMEKMLEQGQYSRAAITDGQLKQTTNLAEGLQTRLAVIRANIALNNGQHADALNWLNGRLTQSAVDDNSLVLVNRLKANIYLDMGDYSNAILFYIQAGSGQSASELQITQNNIWAALSLLTQQNLRTLATETSNYQILGWVELARVLERTNVSLKNQLTALNQWKTVWPRHSAATLLPAPLARLEQTWEQRPRHIALLLPAADAAGAAIQEGFFSAYYQDLDSSDQVPLISVYDSSASTNILPLYEDALANGADLVVGPLQKEQVAQLHQLASLPVPTLALNYVDSLDGYDESIRSAIADNPSNLIQFGLAPEDEIRQVTLMAKDAGYINAAVIAPSGQNYDRLRNIFSNIWQDLNGSVVSSNSFNSESEYADIIKQLMAIDASENRAQAVTRLLPRDSVEFTPRPRKDIDVIFLLANPRQGRQLKPTLAFYYAGDIPVYSLPSINDGMDNQAENNDLNGIVFTDAPWVINKDDALKQVTTQALRTGLGAVQRLRALGVDAYRLYPRLPQLLNKDIISLKGATGTLQIDNAGRLHRKLEAVTFRNGIVEPFLGSSASNP